MNTRVSIGYAFPNLNYEHGQEKTSVKTSAALYYTETVPPQCARIGTIPQLCRVAVHVRDVNIPSP